MQHIAKRYADPNKAVPIESARNLCQNWIRLDATSKDDELTALQLEKQEATVKAALKLLRNKVPVNSSRKDIVIASLDKKVENDCAAIIIAAALDPNFHLDDKSEEILTAEIGQVNVFLGEEKNSISTLSDVLNILDKICGETLNDSRCTTTPAITTEVQNFMERHLGSNSHLLLFTSVDVKIEQRVLTNLQLEGSTIHCHINDDFTYHIQRGKAKVGDITITLTWENECDLDIYIVCVPMVISFTMERKKAEMTLGVDIWMLI